MTLLLLCYLLGDAGSILRLPATMQTPELTWCDLDGDGSLEIWAREASNDATDQHGTFWVWHAAAGSDFQPVPHAPMAGILRPFAAADGFRVRAYHDGHVLHYDAAEGWRERLDFTRLDRIRPGMEPLDLGEGLLVPTFAGYQWVTDDCARPLAARPTVEVRDRRLKLTWPVPRMRDLDGDGVRDLVAAPVRSPQHGNARIWYALHRDGGFAQGLAVVNFPPDEAVAGYQFGDLDGDGIHELAIMTRPDQDLSLFEEMSFRIYKGTETGAWEPVPVQILKTRQNLWQNGPIEMDHHGITFYYYKGLIRDKFRVDRFRWDPAGYLLPKPVTAKWKMDHADRGMIALQHDLNHDGRTDLVLTDSRGMVCFYRRDDEALPFREEPDLVLGDEAGRHGHGFEIEIGEDQVFGQADQGIAGHLKGRGACLVVEPDGPALWSVHQEDDGSWRVQRRPLTRAP